MKIKFEVLVTKQVEIDVPAHWMDYAEAWLARDDERTEEQWDLVELYSWKEMVEEFLSEDEEVYRVEINEVLKNEDEEEEDE